MVHSNIAFLGEFEVDMPGVGTYQHETRLHPAHILAQAIISLAVGGLSTLPTASWL